MSTPAGWYNDDINAVQRYWDGNQWTEHTAPLATRASTPGSKPKSKTPLIAFGALVVVALVAGVTLVLLNRGGDNDTAAAASPEAAIESFFEALGDENLDAMAEAVAPSERSTYIDPLFETVDELKRLGILAESFSTSKIPGVDITISDLTISTTAVSDDIVNVKASGVIAGNISPLALPLGPNLLKLITLEDLQAEITDTTEPAPFEDFTLTAIRENGRWYISPMYSMMEIMRAEGGYPAPDPAKAIQPIGANDPEDAVKSALNTMLGFDLRGVLAHLNPNEASAWQLYAPLFLGDIESELDEMLADTDFELAVSEIDLDVETSGNTALVTMKSLTIKGKLDGVPVTLSMEGDCFSYDVAGESDRICTSDLVDELGGDFEGSFDFSAMSQAPFVVSKVDGSWYLSPIQTITNSYLEQIRALTASDISDLFDALQSGSIEDLLDGPFGNYMGLLNLPDPTILGVTPA